MRKRDKLGRFSRENWLFNAGADVGSFVGCLHYGLGWLVSGTNPGIALAFLLLFLYRMNRG